MFRHNRPLRATELMARRSRGAIGRVRAAPGALPTAAASFGAAVEARVRADRRLCRVPRLDAHSIDATADCVRTAEPRGAGAIFRGSGRLGEAGARGSEPLARRVRPHDFL